MTPKEYLNQTCYMNKKINLLLQEIEQLKELSRTVSSLQYGERISSGNKNTEAPFIQTLMKINKKEEEVNAKIDELVLKKMEIAVEIDKLKDSEERTLLYARYINDKSWEEIYTQLYRSKSATHRIHASALRNFIVPN